MVISKISELSTGGKNWNCVARMCCSKHCYEGSFGISPPKKSEGDNECFNIPWDFLTFFPHEAPGKGLHLPPFFQGSAPHHDGSPKEHLESNPNGPLGAEGLDTSIRFELYSHEKVDVSMNKNHWMLVT